MNRHVNAIASRLSLRPPQRRSLEILDRMTEINRITGDTALRLGAFFNTSPEFWMNLQKT
ncbi:MAG: hypothetical protein WD425_05615 [Nitrospirales bacterium]